MKTIPKEQEIERHQMIHATKQNLISAKDAIVAYLNFYGPDAELEAIGKEVISAFRKTKLLGKQP